MKRKEKLRLGNWVLFVEEAGYDEWELQVTTLRMHIAELSNFHAVYTNVKLQPIHPLQLYHWHLEYAGFTKVKEDVYE